MAGGRKLQGEADLSSVTNSACGAVSWGMSKFYRQDTLCCGSTDIRRVFIVDKGLVGFWFVVVLCFGFFLHSVAFLLFYFGLFFFLDLCGSLPFFFF